MECFDVVEATDGNSVGLAVDVGNQVSAFTDKGSAEINIRVVLNIESFGLEVGAESFMQKSALPDQARPAMHLHAVQQPQGNRVVIRLELLEPVQQ